MEALFLIYYLMLSPFEIFSQAQFAISRPHLWNIFKNNSSPCKANIIRLFNNSLARWIQTLLNELAKHSRRVRFFKNQQVTVTCLRHSSSTTLVMRSSISVSSPLSMHPWCRHGWAAVAERVVSPTTTWHHFPPGVLLILGRGRSLEGTWWA